VKIHKFAMLFPVMSREAIEELANDIREKGQLQPITTYKGEIVDGRNRYEAMRIILGWPEDKLWTIEFDGNESDVVARLDSLNSRRRHMSAQQRACSAVLRMALSKDLPDVPKINRENAARLFGVSDGYIGQAHSIHSSYPDLFQEVFRGDRKLGEAYQWMLSKRKSESVQPAQSPEPPPDNEPVGGVVGDVDTMPPETPIEDPPERQELTGTDRPEPQEEEAPPPRGFSRTIRCLFEADPIRIRIEVHSNDYDVAFCPICGEELEADDCHEEVDD